MSDYAIIVKEHCTMVSIDDKHRGEPGYPVAAVERGRRVMVKAGTIFGIMILQSAVLVHLFIYPRPNRSTLV